MNKLFLSLVLGISLLIVSCETNNKTFIDITNTQGYYVVNEGSFGSSNASIGFLDESGTYHDDLFTNTNNRPMGDVFQSMYIHNNTAYLIMNGSNKIEIINANNFEEKGVIKNVYTPRYMEIVNGTGYVTQWGNGTTEQGAVKVINLSTKKVIKTINTGYGSEGMLVSGSNLLVANSGGYGVANTISVINTTSNELIKTITLEENNPYGFVKDKNGDIWVLCYGSVEYNEKWEPIAHTRSALIKLSPTTFEPIKTIELSSTEHPTKIGINPAGDVIYYGGGYSFFGLYAISITADVAPSNSLIDASLYGFMVNSTNGEIIGLKAPTYTSAGLLTRYQPDGTEISTISVGIGPNGAVYKNK